MTILYILSGTSPQAGSSKSFLNMIYEVRKAGHRCIVICPNKNGIFNTLSNNCIETYSIHYVLAAIPKNHSLIGKLINKIRWWRRMMINSIATQILRKLCTKIHPDLIHSNTSVNNIGYNVAKILNIPHITHIREYGDFDFNLDLPYLNDQLNSPIGYAIAITKDLFKYRNLKLDKSRVIYNGICSIKDIHFKGNKQNYFLYAGRIHKSKGICTLIDAYIEYLKISPNPLRLKIAGGTERETETRQILEQIIKEHGIQDYIDWLGECKNISDLMQKAYATIIPSLYEGFGRVMPEAIANGCLVIGRATGGTREQLENGIEITGHPIGISFDSTASLTAILLKITKDGIEHYTDMILRGQEVIKQLYTTEIHGKNILNFYSDIIAKSLT